MSKDLIDIVKNGGEFSSNPKNFNVVMQCLDTIFEIPLGSFLFNRSVGNDIEKLLFEPFNIATKQALEHKLLYTIGSQCPVAEIQKFNIEMDYDKREYKVEVSVLVDNIPIEYKKRLKAN